MWCKNKNCFPKPKEIGYIEKALWKKISFLKCDDENKIRELATEWDKNRRVFFWPPPFKYKASVLGLVLRSHWVQYDSLVTFT